MDRLGPDGAPPEDELRKVFKQRTSYFKHLANRWQKEYLLQLRSAHATKGRVFPEIRTGDVCLVRDENQPRLKWALVRILEAHVGRDGNVRTYSVRFANGATSRRAAQLLYPLEVAPPIQEASSN